MKLKPMADNVLLKQHEAAETTVSGIILATTSKEKPAIYEVVSVGPCNPFFCPFHLVLLLCQIYIISYTVQVHLIMLL
ncbi:MAG: hypothetical protein II320_03165 [Oscillospiraceae bacterium]|nr:hypothetical protein [Oscillospiraceae bacterium]